MQARTLTYPWVTIRCRLPHNHDGRDFSVAKPEEVTNGLVASGAYQRSLHAVVFSHCDAWRQNRPSPISLVSHMDSKPKKPLKPMPCWRSFWTTQFSRFASLSMDSSLHCTSGSGRPGRRNCSIQHVRISGITQECWRFFWRYRAEVRRGSSSNLSGKKSGQNIGKRQEFFGLEKMKSKPCTVSADFLASDVEEQRSANHGDGPD